MDDCSHLEQLSGPNGALANVAKLCHALNTRMTKAFDSLFDPEATDTLDASCNTCKHFQREAFDRKFHSISTYGFPGYCVKLHKKTTGWPRGQYDGFNNDSCYENRRTGLTPAQLVSIQRGSQ